jgi:hypothetical protein
VRRDAAEADRRREVRVAARGWRRAGAIDDRLLDAVVRSYPDDRVRLGPSFRGLAFVFTALALNAVFFFVIAVFRPDARPLAIAGTSLIPLAAIAFGVLTRRRLFLDVGLALGIVSLVTLRFYVHVAPLWVMLTLGGGAAIAAALALRRFLASGVGGERGGFSAKPLFEDPGKHRSLEVAAALAASPAVKVTASDDRSLAPGGGRFGGGGASGEY